MARSEHREPAQIDQAVRSVMARAGLDRPDVMLQLVRQWEALVPEPFASSARPGVLRAGTLEVVASSRSHVGFLQVATPQLLAALQAHFGGEVVVRVEVVAPQ